MSKKKTFCIDIDNTICITINNFYKNSKPIKKNIELINDLYKKGHTIIFFTARGMNKYKGNKNKIHKVYYKFTRDQLIAWGVKFHKLILCKPSYDFAIDDKSIFFKKNWTKKINNLLKKI
jgi:ribonucleotide monophosphatase NagD (HAD superfamily)